MEASHYTSMSGAGQSQPASECLSEAQPTALTRIEAFKIMLREAKKLGRHLLPRHLPKSTKVKLVEEHLGFDMSAQSPKTQENIIKSISRFTCKFETKYKNCYHTLNRMKKKHGAWLSRDFRLEFPSDLVFHSASNNKLDDENVSTTQQLTEDTLVSDDTPIIEEKGKGSLIVEEGDKTKTIDYKQILRPRKIKQTQLESEPPRKHVKTFTETVSTDPDTEQQLRWCSVDPEPLNLEHQNTNPNRLNVSKTCCFCKKVQVNCIQITDSRPYIISNRTKITLNDMSIEINFNKGTAPKNVCWNCDSKLVEIFEFVKLVSKAQHRLNHAIHVVDLNSGFDTQNEDQLSMSCNGDAVFDDDKYNITDVKNEDEESESVKQRIIAHKRKGDEEENLMLIKRCRNNDCDPLSINNNLDNNEMNHDYDEMFKCGEEIDDKGYAKEFIFADTIADESNDSNEENETHVKEEFTGITIDEEQLSEPNVTNELNNTGTDNLIMNIKEESIETYEEHQQHEIELEREPAEFHQDMEHYGSQIRGDRLYKIFNAKETASSGLANESSSKTVGAMPIIDLSLLKKSIMSKLMKK